jgi:hypothetical protein
MVRKLVPSYISDCEMAPEETQWQTEVCELLDQTWNLSSLNLQSCSEPAGHPPTDQGILTGHPGCHPKKVFQNKDVFVEYEAYLEV